MSQPKVSIITVCFNAEKHLTPTIESVITQTFKEYEYIIIDGSSTDRTLEMVEKYRKSITAIISEPDNGVYDAMNKGLSMARGEYILFLNAGDELSSPRVLQEIFIDGENADLFYGETIILNAERNPIGTRTELTSRKLPEKLKKEDFLNGQVVSHQSFISKRDLCPKYNLRYECSADIDWMLQVISRSKLVVKTENPISKYLQGGISDRQLRKCWKERFFIMLNHFNIWLVIFVHFKFIFRFLKIGAYKSN